jgi:iron(II)-dependent oxidoreductase
VSRETLIQELENIQALLLALAQDASETTLRGQYHADLSPLGWHLGHSVYIECLWLHERLRGDDSVTAPLADLYTPPVTPKAERGRLLPAKASLLEWAREMQAFNVRFVRNLPAELARHALLEDDYLLHFLTQHHSQHYETMVMVLTQKALAEPSARHSAARLDPAAPRRDEARIAAGHYRIGGQRPSACDNELPPQRAELGEFGIARQPVTNAEYLAFMEDQGYQREAHWDAAGWQWRCQSGAQHPDHWRRNAEGVWYGSGVRGDYDLAADQPVSGISHHEARAFADWAGARLPHEYQWEVARRLGALQETGRVWEWCDNSFHPYQGFQPFPYREYSEPWFDGRHFALRGGSLHTRPAIKRPSFRNFYEADKRHIFAGLRLAY